MLTCEFKVGRRKKCEKRRKRGGLFCQQHMQEEIMANEEELSQTCEESVDEHEPNQKKHALKYRNALRSFFKFINKIMKDFRPLHIQILKTTPFWEFINLFVTKNLQLDDIKRSSDCLDEVLNRYNPVMDNFKINGFPLEIKNKDVAKIFGLANEGITIKVWQVKEKKSLPSQCIEFINKYLLENENLNKKVIEREVVKILNDGDEESCKDVVRFIIMHLMCSFFFSNSNSNIKWSFLPYLHDFDIMREVNWPKSILFNLKEHVKKFAANPRRNNSCVTIFLYWICDKLPLMERRETYQERMPTVAKWKLSKLKNVLTSDFLSTVDEEMINIEDRDDENSDMEEDLQKQNKDLKIYIGNLEKQNAALLKENENLKMKLARKEFSSEDHTSEESSSQNETSLFEKSEERRESGNENTESEEAIMESEEAIVENLVTDSEIQKLPANSSEAAIDSTEEAIMENLTTESEIQELPANSSEAAIDSSEEVIMENLTTESEMQELPVNSSEAAIDSQKEELQEFEYACSTYNQSFIVYKNTDENIIISSTMLQNYMSRKSVDDQILNWYITSIARNKHEENVYFKSDEAESLMKKGKNNQFIQKHFREKLQSKESAIQLLFFPIKHLNNHWTLLVYYYENGEWFHYNSVKSRPNNYAQKANTIKENAIMSINEVLTETGVHTKRKKTVLIEDQGSKRYLPDTETSASDMILFMKALDAKFNMTSPDDLTEPTNYYAYLILSDAKFGWERKTTKFV